MEEWIKAFIVKQVKVKKADEIRKFKIAYKLLDPSLHGYLSSLAQNECIFKKRVDTQELKRFCKENKINNIWNNDRGIYITTKYPYLGLAGCIEACKQESRALSISLEVGSIDKSKYIKAKVITDKGTTEGMADLVSSDSTLSFEKVASFAIRKALGYLGYGRFPTDTTEYKELINEKV